VVLEALRDRRLGRALGWLVVALAFGLIGTRLWQGGAWDLIRPRLELLLLATTGGALIYGVAGFLLSAAWREILACEHPPGPAAAYHSVYGRTQIAKYLPGNCFHFVGRQILGPALGHSQAALALASLVEGILLTAVAASLALPLALHRFGGWSIMLLAGVIAGLALVFATPRLLPARFRPGAGAPAGRGGGYRARRLLRALALQVAFFAAAGAVLWLLAALLVAPQAAAPGLLTSIGALALAWVAGFVTPGAAAGIGVREAVLMVALDGPLGPEASAVVALAFRLVTTAGDGVFCVLALALPLPPRTTNTPVSK
jgi:glycosyltransferase 2 family protein